MGYQGKYKSNYERRMAYKKEKEERWDLEKYLLEPIAELLKKALSKSFENVSYDFYAESLISDFKNKHGSEIEIPDEIRGAPDLHFLVDKKEWYIELKIKRHRFHKTSDPEIYGCESHYLDDYPVYKNLQKHSNFYNIKTGKIILLFAVNEKAGTGTQIPLSETDWEFEAITLKNLTANIKLGRYRSYKGGYGQRTWLIRCDDLVGLDLFAN